MKVSRRPVFFSHSVHFVRKISYLRVLLDLKHKITESPNEATPPAGSTVASRCPFLTAEKNRVIREASVELQEDIQEMDSRCKGEQPHTRLLKMTTKLQSL